MKIDITVEPKNHPAIFTGFEQNRFKILSKIPYPPGAPCTIVFQFEQESMKTEARTIGSKKIDSEDFEVALRFVSLPKKIRERLELLI